MRHAAELEERVSASGPSKVDSREDGQVFVSVVVPVSERPAVLTELYRDYSAPLRALAWAYEFVFVAEPSFHDLVLPLRDLAASGEPIRVFESGQVVGESALLRLGAAHSRGEILLVLPAYYRVEADALPKVIDSVQSGADLAIARRWPRRDSWINRAQSWAFHALLGGLTERRVHDVACGVRAMRREVLEDLPLYGDFFRFLPLFALRHGYRVEEITAQQHALDVPARIYRPSIYLRRLIDVLGLFFLLRFTQKPLRFFGLVGASFWLVGSVVLAVVFVQRLSGRGLANRPVLLLGVLLAVLGFQAIALGLIGEIIVYLRSPRYRFYRLKSEQAGEAGDQQRSMRKQTEGE